MSEDLPNPNDLPQAETSEDGVVIPSPRKPGFHVVNEEGITLGVYDTAEDAEAFADSHPRANGLTVTVEEVKA